MSLLLLAGLAQVPEELHEAARLDGAGAVRSFLAVTLPAMRTTLLVAVLFRALDAYRIFDTVFVMTAGAQRTETVSFLAYRQMIGRTALGLGSAVSVLLFLTVVLFAAAFVKVLRLELAPAGGGR
jgi:multiple sugar transport system permease protein